jgi:hypothetical protein
MKVFLRLLILILKQNKAATPKTITIQLFKTIFTIKLVNGIKTS